MKMRLIIALALATVAAAPASGQSSRDARLRAHLQERFGDERAQYPDTRYVASWVDLNGDRRPEVLVYMISSNWCGTGGCTLYIFTPEQGGWYQHGSLVGVHGPVTVLNTRRNGWRDLAYRVSGGGASPHTAIVRQGQITYDQDGATHQATTPRGRVVISGNERGRPLF